MLDSFFAKEEDKKLFKNLVIVLTSVLILLVAALFVNTLRASKFVGLDVTPANTLSFTGVAEIEAVPDIATISFSVEETNKDVKVAQDVVSEKISAILNALESEDVEEKDIQTQQYSVYPQYRYNPENGAQTIIGQVVSQNVTVKVRDIESVPEILTLLATNEVKNINGPSFDIDDKDELERQVRQLAIEEAKAQAKELAGDLGVRLVRIVGYNESGSGEVPPMPYYSGVAMDMESTKAAPEIPAGENTIRSSVTITYEVR
jgi:uncharacterized protein YggE